MHIDRAWLLDLAAQHLRADPDVTDYGSLAAAVARHADVVIDGPVYAEPHHRAAALLHQLVRVPALGFANEQFAAVVAAAYLTLSGKQVVVDAKGADALIRRVVDGLDLRATAAQMRSWIAG
ncbi:fic family toxin-antitoxin system, toxin component [Streptomyces sp. A3M-1-3]|uniref:fic family toxin-antitoxin system, toxin component n=1 Tax=Streptomyces sp. A3M-1-3 TaxID=2962044 RepID=UPI0020B8521E|nr:fic family toxin-antitoxin system, toxin component [Streptomyces sp. A3M-1-3]MCP3822033.1 fic family toxin-antitoxin system, toxin component [Streptomyces sp. A3M-1-3]